MDRKQKAIIIVLWAALLLEWVGLLVLIYFAKLPYFLSLFVVLIQLISPWLIMLNIFFLFFTLFSRGLEFTLEFWGEYLHSLLRFFIQSFLFALIVIIASAILGTALGISAERLSSLPTVKAIQEWIARHFY